MKSTIPVLLIFFVSSMAANPATRRATPVAKSKTVGPSHTVKKTPAGKSSSTRLAAKGKSGKRSVQTAKRTAPRQSAPTPERYMQIQQALADKGYYSGPVNGVWDADSVDALKKFQAAQNLSADGKLGALSLIGLGLGPKREPLAQLSAKPGSNP